MPIADLNLKFFDHYQLNARVFPAVISATPAIAALGAVLAWRGISVPSGIASACLVVLFFAMSDLARRRGKLIEPRLFARLGGMPSIRMLSRTDTTLTELSKQRYRAFLAARLGRPEPTADQEARDKEAANEFYAAAGNWLRENTRDKQKFKILFDENVTYGFRRNLLGLRAASAILSSLIFAVCLLILCPLSWPLNFSSGFVLRDLFVLGVSIFYGLYLIFVVTWRAAEEAANSYGRQLILSIDILRSSDH